MGFKVTWLNVKRKVGLINFCAASVTSTKPGKHRAFSLLGFEHLHFAESENAHSSLHFTQHNNFKFVFAYFLVEW